MIDTLSRTLVGFRVPQGVAEKLSDLQMQIKRKAMTDLRFTDASEFVITLVNLGETPIARLAALPQALEAALAGVRSAAVTAAGLEGAPNNIQPRFALVKIGGDLAGLQAIQQATMKACAQVVGPMEPKPFAPSIQIARLRQEGEAQRTALGRGMKLLAGFDAGSFTVDKVSIFLSEAGDGVRLIEHKAYPLG